MGVKQMSRTEQERFEKSMIEQGVKVRRTNDGGFWLLLPNQERLAVHITSSDVNAQKTIFRKLRGAGVIHPDDKTDVTKLPPYITERTISANVRKSFIDWWIKAGYPKEVYASDVVKELWPRDPAGVNRALYHTGFKPIYKKRSAREKRAWVAPEELLRMAPLPTEELLKQEATHPLVRPVPGTIGERINEQLKDRQREVETVPAGSHPTKPVNRVSPPTTEKPVTIAHAENIVKQGGIPPKVEKPKRAYTEIERALAQQGRSIDDLDNRVVQVAESGTAGELVDAQAEHISVLKEHSAQLEEELVQTAADEGSLSDELEALRMRNAELVAEAEAAMAMASEAEAALTAMKEADSKRKEQVLDRELEEIIMDHDDSWVVDLSELFGPSFERIFGDKVALLTALGLEHQFRVWRKKP